MSTSPVTCSYCALQCLKEFKSYFLCCRHFFAMSTISYGLFCQRIAAIQKHWHSYSYWFCQSNHFINYMMFFILNFSSCTALVLHFFLPLVSDFKFYCCSTFNVLMDQYEIMCCILSFLTISQQWSTAIESTVYVILHSLAVCLYLICSSIPPLP